MRKVCGIGVAVIVVMVALVRGQSEAKLSEIEQLRLRVHRTEVMFEQAVADANACRGELGAYRAKVRSLDLTIDEQVIKAEIEKAHAGFVFDPKTGVFTPKPSEPKKDQNQP